MAVVIRNGTHQDVVALSRIDQQAAAFPWTAGHFSDSLDSHACLVLEAAGEIQGFLVYSALLDEVELLNVAVLPVAQGRGYGARLMDHFMALNRPLASHVLLEVRASNQPAIQLYEGRGFVRVAVRKQYYPATDGREDAWIMRYDY